MKLYYAPGTCSLACWIALEWAGVDYQVEAVDPQLDSYRRINPLGTVPAVDMGGDRCMTQAGAILMYIADLAGEQSLGADLGAAARLEFDEVMCFLTGDFHPAFWPFFSPQRYTEQTDQDSLASVRAAAETRIDRAMTHLDRLIGDTGHVYRGRRSVADAYAFVMARWSANLSKTWRGYVHLAPFMQRMGTDEAVRKVLSLSEAR